MLKYGSNKLVYTISRLSKYTLLYILISLSTVCFAQRRSQYNVENISTEIYQLEKGISQNTVRFILEDRKGYLWFGTWDGLNRYDGTEFKYFTPSITNPDSSIVQQTINALIQDANDNIWVGTDGGLSLIDYRTFATKNFHLSSEFLSDTIHTLFQENDGTIWIGTQRGIALLKPQTDSIIPLNKYYANCDSLAGKEIRLIKKFENRFWIATAEGLYQINKQENKLQVSRIKGLCDLHITSIIAIKDSLLIIGTENGLNTLNLKDNSIQHYHVDDSSSSLTSNVIIALLYIDNKSIWIGTSGGGINKFDLNTSQITPINLSLENQGHQNKLHEIDPYIYSLYQSRNGIIWVGTAWHGVMKVNEKQNIFKAFQKTTHGKGITDNHIWSFANTDSSLLIGTEAGIGIYNTSKHKFTYLTKKDGLSSNQIRSLFIDSEDNLWVGTFKGGLNYYNTKTLENTIFSTKGDSSHHINDNSIWTIIEDERKQIWFGTYNGLYCYNLSNQKIRSYTSSTEDSNSISNNAVYCSSIDQNGHIWFGTYSGLNEYNPQTDKFTVYKHIEGDSLSLSVNRIFSIYDDKEGNLWLGTVGGGLNKFDKKTKTFKWFTTKNGLPNNVIYASIPDKHGNLWLSTNYGICKFNIESETTICYDVNDGLLSNELNKGAAMSGKNGNIYFGGMFGFNVFNPDKIIQNMKKPKIVVTSLSSIDKPTQYDLESGAEIILSYNKNDFQIRYAVLDFTNPQKNRYKHRLIGYDRDWIITSSNHPIGLYSRVEPGKYEFQITGANNDGIWNSVPFIIQITIKPPWYRQPIFIIGTSLLMIILITLMIRARINRLKAKHQIERQMFEMERQALRLQMNPHFIFNTLNSIQAFILKNKTKESIAYLSKFSRLMRAILNNSQESLIAFDNEVETLHAYMELEQLRFEHRFKFSIHVSSDIDQEFIGIAPMLIQPYVENAIIHGVGPLKERDGEISIDFQVDGKYIICTINDNGVGRAYHKKKNNLLRNTHKSSGITISSNRLNMIDQEAPDKIHMEITDLVEENGDAIGTRIILYIIFEEI